METEWSGSSARSRSYTSACAKVSALLVRNIHADFVLGIEPQKANDNCNLQTIQIGLPLRIVWSSSVLKAVLFVEIVGCAKRRTVMQQNVIVSKSVEVSH